MNLLDKIFDRNFDGTQRLLDLAWRRNEAITSNIANAETPGYRAVDVTFADELEKAFGNVSEESLKRTDARHMDTSFDGMSHLVSDFSGMTRSDGNNVDLDIQMGKLAQNSGRYNLAADLVRKKVQILTNAIRYSRG